MTSTHTTTERRYVDGRTLDEKDNIILDILEHNGRATLAQLAEAASLSISATQSRVQKLEKNGVIVGYRAIIHYPEQTTGTIHAFVSVTPLEYDENANIPEKLEHINGIDSCDAVSGSQVYVLTVTVPTVPQQGPRDRDPPHRAIERGDDDGAAPLFPALTQCRRCAEWLARRFRTPSVGSHSTLL